MRDSDLIRKLLKSGVSYRQISLIAACSHGSVSAERAAIKKEEAELKAKLAAQAEAERELQALGSEFPEIPKPKATEPTPS